MVEFFRVSSKDDFKIGVKMMERNISQKKISTENTVGKQILYNIAHQSKKETDSTIPPCVEEKIQEAYRKIFNE